MTEYIWNGVGLTTPDLWEPSALERDGFLLEDSGTPKCELKWRTVQGRFSFEKHIKKLTKSSKNADMHAVPDESTPELWHTAMTRLKTSGIASQSFIWQANGHRGIGAALHNSGTGLAALIQFFIANDDDAAVAAATLASFRDYSAGKTIPWTMFGLTGRVPATFRLSTFSFKPGRYTIQFWRPKTAKQGHKLPAGKGPGTALSFERLAPANVLLKGTDLQTWATETMDDMPPEDMIEGNETSLYWNGVTKSSTLRKLMRRQMHGCGKVWTTTTGNAILSVTASGTIPLDEPELTTITESYGLIQKA